uniref:Uncharacterized mitochondrial protein AtMg00810-like n=1 Tax=Tanacetum cinerariifolium TaxID=118510 RepID=A0A6L2KBG8_TANCI|nr:uncharacterized mitochondrial protein AtMg00810-like [Tanacetum cinerariifolium]
MWFLGCEHSLAASTKVEENEQWWGSYLGGKRKYALDLLKYADTLDIKPVATPMDLVVKLNEKDGDPLTVPTHYKTIVATVVEFETETDRILWAFDSFGPCGVKLKFCRRLSYGYAIHLCFMIDYAVWYVHFDEMDAYVTAGSLAKVAESPRLVDKMKYVFGRSRSKDESFAGLMRDLCCALRVSLSKNRRLVAELEAVGDVEGAAKFLKHMRVFIARDVVTLGELETLLVRAQVGVSLKSGFVVDIEVKE